MNSSLLAGGKHYDLLVNWEKRLSSEIPFLTDLFKEINPPIKTILEVGCGTARHAAVLHNDLGYRVTGVDIDESMIEEANLRVPDAEMLVHDFLDSELFTPQGRSFDAIISLGNSVGLMASNSDFENIVSRFSQVLRKSKGLLIFHLLNTEYSRNGWSPPRSVLTTDGEYIFLRGFTTTEEFVYPEIITLFRPNDANEWQMMTTGKANIPRINHTTVLSLLKEYGFSNIRVFGNYQKSLFDPSSSIDTIYICNT